MENSIVDCPFCEGEEGGCCFCDHSGKIMIGKGMPFERESDTQPFKPSYKKHIEELSTKIKSDPKIY